MATVNTRGRKNVRVVFERGPDGEEVAWIEFRPWSTLGHGAGQRTAVSTLAAGEDVGTSMVGYTIALARWGGVAWGGVYEAATEEEVAEASARGEEPVLQPLAFSADNLQELLEQDRVAFAAVDREYATPALEAEAEKNGSALQPGGTSPGSPPGKPAGAQGSAAETTAAPAKRSARNALTSKPPRKRKAAN